MNKKYAWIWLCAIALIAGAVFAVDIDFTTIRPQKDVAGNWESDVRLQYRTGRGIADLQEALVGKGTNAMQISGTINVGSINVGNVGVTNIPTVIPTNTAATPLMVRPDRSTNAITFDSGVTLPAFGATPTFNLNSDTNTVKLSGTTGTIAMFPTNNNANPLFTTPTTIDAGLIFTNITNADPAVPVVLGVAGWTFKAITFTGYKASRTANDNDVYIQNTSVNDAAGTSPIRIQPEQERKIEAAPGTVLKASDFWLDVVTAGNGVGIRTYN